MNVPGELMKVDELWQQFQERVAAEPELAAAALFALVLLLVRHVGARPRRDADAARR